MVSKTELERKFKEFKHKFALNYSPAAWEFIEEHFFTDMEEKDVPDILKQVYSELGVKAPSVKYYHKHLNLLKKLYPLDGNIVEVASGRIPAFANLIAREQGKIGKGTITLYDPLLVDLTPKYPNMALHKEPFDENTDIRDANLVVSLFPCEVTEHVLNSAIANDKDFYVALCGCAHRVKGPFGYYNMPASLYQQKVIDDSDFLLKDLGYGTLGVKSFKGTPYDYPILYRKK